MLLQTCRYINDFFEVRAEQGTFSITDGKLIGNKLPYPVGSYLLIEKYSRHREGSILNSGLHLVTDSALTIKDSIDETWSGYIYLSVIPKDLINLVSRIQDFQTAIDALTEQTGGLLGLYKSESFGEYSYTLGSDNDGNILTDWKIKFNGDLAKYKSKKMFNYIEV